MLYNLHNYNFKEIYKILKKIYKLTKKKNNKIIQKKINDTTDLFFKKYKFMSKNLSIKSRATTIQIIDKKTKKKFIFKIPKKNIILEILNTIFLSQKINDISPKVYYIGIININNKNFIFIIMESIIGITLKDAILKYNLSLIEKKKLMLQLIKKRYYLYNIYGITFNDYNWGNFILKKNNKQKNIIINGKVYKNSKYNIYYIDFGWTEILNIGKLSKLLKIGLHYSTILSRIVKKYQNIKLSYKKILKNIDYKKLYHLLLLILFDDKYIKDFESYNINCNFCKKLNEKCFEDNRYFDNIKV